MLVLENDPHSKDAVDEIFRAAHTLKGGSATVQMFELSEFTHVLEDILDEIRSGAAALTGALVDTLLQAVDVIKAMLDERLAGNVFDGDVEPLKNQLRSYLPGASKAPPPPKNRAARLPPNRCRSPRPEAFRNTTFSSSRKPPAAAMCTASAWPSTRLTPMNSVGGIQVFAALKSMGTVLKTVPEFDKLYEDTYWPSVDYYCLLDKENDVVIEKCKIREVTTSVEILEVGDEAEAQTRPGRRGKGARRSAPRRLPYSSRWRPNPRPSTRIAKSLIESVLEKREPDHKKAPQHRRLGAPCRFQAH